MSMIPYFFDHDQFAPWSRRHFDQNFGLALSPEELLSVQSPILPRYRPWWPKEIVGSSIKSDKDKWQINVDVQHFTPDEVTVKTTDGFIFVEGKHEEKKDEHGFVSRQFLRRFKLPAECNVDAVESRLSSDGVLTVTAPKNVDCLKGERAVPITPTGPIRKEVTNAVKTLKDDGKVSV